MSQPSHWPKAPSRPVRLMWWTAVAAPIVAVFLLQWLPPLNGPHLWLGLPPILWWTMIPGSAMVTLVLLFVEHTRTDDDEQDRLDDEAAAESDQRVREQEQT